MKIVVVICGLLLLAGAILVVVSFGVSSKILEDMNKKDKDNLA